MVDKIIEEIKTMDKKIKELDSLNKQYMSIIAAMLERNGGEFNIKFSELFSADYEKVKIKKDPAEAVDTITLILKSNS